MAGVERAYGPAGDSLSGVADANRDTNEIGWTCVRHEGPAAFAARGDAHLTARSAVRRAIRHSILRSGLLGRVAGLIGAAAASAPSPSPRRSATRLTN